MCVAARIDIASLAGRRPTDGLARRLIWLYALTTAATYWVVWHSRTPTDGLRAEIFWAALDAFLVRRMLLGSRRAIAISLFLCAIGLGLIAMTTITSVSVEHRDLLAPLALAQVASLSAVAWSRATPAESPRYRRHRTPPQRATPR